MDCKTCKHNHGGTGREVVQLSGYSVHVPCITEDIPRRKRTITDGGKCSAYCEERTPVDPALTRESVCGECIALKDIKHHSPGRCELRKCAKFPDNIACVKFKAKPTAKPLEAADCLYREWDNQLGASCNRQGNNGGCHKQRGDDVACQFAKPKEPSP